MGNELVPVDGGATVALDQGAPINSFWDGTRGREIAGPLPPATAIETERRSIEKLMGDENSAYWKGPDAATLQGRYLALCGDESGSADVGDDGAVLLEVPPGADPTLVQAAEDILANVPSASRPAFEAAFDTLPASVRRAASDELASPAPAAKPVGPAGLREFATRPEGAELVREWGREAPVRLARVRARLLRWFGRVPADQRAAALAWFDALSPTEASAIYRVVSA